MADQTIVMRYIREERLMALLRSLYPNGGYSVSVSTNYFYLFFLSFSLMQGGMISNTGAWSASSSHDDSQINSQTVRLTCSTRAGDSQPWTDLCPTSLPWSWRAGNSGIRAIIQPPVLALLRTKPGQPTRLGWARRTGQTMHPDS